MSFLNDNTLSLLHRGLNVGLQRQLVLSSNVANLDTPGFTPSDIDFSAAIERAEGSSALKQTNSRHMSINGDTRGAVEAQESPDKVASTDGNSVDLDMQMARLGQNGVAYQANIKAVSKKLAVLKYAASEGAL